MNMKPKEKEVTKTLGKVIDVNQLIKIPLRFLNIIYLT